MILVSFTLFFVCRGNKMIVLDDKQKLIVSRLEVSNPLPSRMIKEYDFNNMRKEFKDLLDLMQENYFNQVCYQEFLKYKITEDLVFVTVEDPKYGVLTIDCMEDILNQMVHLKFIVKSFIKCI